MNKNLFIMTAIASSALLAGGCRSQQEAVPAADATEAATEHYNTLLSKSGNLHGIESFPSLTTGDYKEAILLGMEKQKQNSASSTNSAVRKIVRPVCSSSHWHSRYE